MELINKLSKLREQLSYIKAQILIVEQDIAAQTPDQKLEGITTTEWGSITTKLTRTITDYAKYLSVEEGLPGEARFIELKPTISLKKLRIAEVVNKTLVRDCITVKSGKPTIKINGGVK